MNEVVMISICVKVTSSLLLLGLFENIYRRSTRLIATTLIV